MRVNFLRLPLRQPMTLFLKVCSLALLLSSCAAVQEKDLSTAAPQSMPMAAPQGPARRIVQQIRAEWPGRLESLLCVLELYRDRIAVAGLRNDGLPLFNLSYDGKALSLEKSPVLPDAVDPQFIIGDIQLAYWPAAELRKILPPDWRLDVAEDRRSLYVQDQKRAEVIYLPSTVENGYWPKNVDLINYPYHYRLHITTISYDALPE